MMISTNATAMVTVICLLFLAGGRINGQDIEAAQPPAEANEIKPMMGGYPSEIASAMRCQARGKYDEAIQLYRQAAEKYANTVNVPMAYAGIGNCYKLQGQDAKAKEFYQRAIPLFKEIIAKSNTNEIVYYHSNARLAEIFLQLEDWKRTAQYLSWAVTPQASIILGARELGGYCMPLGDAYAKQDKWEDAVSAYTKALEHFTKAGGPLSNIAATHSRLGECYTKLRNWEAARNELQIQIDIGERFLKDNPDLRESRREKLSKAIKANKIKLAGIESNKNRGDNYLFPVVVGIVIVASSVLVVLIKRVRHHNK